MRWLIYVLGKLSLNNIQSLGSFLGLMTYYVSRNDRELIHENIQQASSHSHLQIDPLRVAKSSGMLLLDSLWIWQNPQKALDRTEVKDWHIVQEAIQEGRGLLMLTPHLGAFEMIPRILAEHFPATIIYKPAKQAWLERVIEKGRAHSHMHFVPANMQGVRQVARALQRGEAVGILPDQVPNVGDGVWAPFFGRLAYTAVLPAKLALKNSVPTIIFSAIRKPAGKGWIIFAKRIEESFSSDSATSAKQINEALEHVIAQYPEQYLWGYRRYKQPTGAPPPPESIA